MNKADFFFCSYNFGNQANVCYLATTPAGPKENQVTFLQVFFLYAGPYLALLVGTAGKFYVYRIKGLAQQTGTVDTYAGSATEFIGSTIIGTRCRNYFFDL